MASNGLVIAVASPAAKTPEPKLMNAEVDPFMDSASSPATGTLCDSKLSLFLSCS